MILSDHAICLEKTKANPELSAPETPGHDGLPSNITIVSDDDLQGREVPNLSVAENLSHAPDPEVRERALEMGVEMSPPGERDTWEWLEIAIQEKRIDLLRKRLQNFPVDPETILALTPVKAAR